MRKITVAEAIKLLESDKTAHNVSIIFKIGNNHPELNSQYDRELDSNVIIIDAGKCCGIKQTIMKLATYSLMGGIYTR